MKVIRETCIAGMTIDRMIKVSSGSHSAKRGKKKRITREAVRKNNDRIAVKDLTRKLNCNFKPGDKHLTLTYAVEPSQKEAAVDREKFIRRLRIAMRKANKELKYIVVTEYLNKRIHHHVVTNCRDLEIIEKCWDKGWIKSSSLDNTGNYYKLAEYLIKETSKTMRMEKAIHKRRYTCSRNIVTPVVIREEVSPKELTKEPKAISGYYIPRDCVRRFLHPITGLEHLEYIEVAEDKPRKYKRWRNGKEVTRKEYYKANYWEEQLSL